MLGKVEICGVNTAKLRILSADEMQELLRRTKAGDESAREMLIEGNLRLVLSVIQRFSGRGESADDLFQVGCVGLLKAIRNFDPTKEVRFSTYGVPMTIEWRKTEREVFPMTRKEALSLAIEALEATGQSEAAEILHTISDDLPLNRWSDASIRDAVEQYILDHGKVPTPYAFKKKGLPPHTVIRNRYGIILSEWLAENYPTVRPTKEERQKKATEAFREEYLRLKPKSAEEFNTKRSPGVYSWICIARYYHTTRWRKLLEILELPAYSNFAISRVPPEFNVEVFTHYDFRDKTPEIPGIKPFYNIKKY